MSLSQQLSWLEGAGLIRVAQVAPELAYHFRHGLIQEAAHGALVRADRRRLHRLTGETLAALYPDQLDELAPDLAVHFAAAGDFERAIGYHRRAARLAQARYANAEALQQLQAAHALLPDDAPAALRLALLEELADAHGLLGEPTAALGHLQAALALVPTPPAADDWDAVRLHRKVIENLTAMGGSVSLAQTEAALRAAAPSLRAGPALATGSPPHAETVRLLVALAQLHARAPYSVAGWHGSLDDAERYATRAVAQAEQLGTPAAFSAALGVLAGVLYGRGRLRERLAVAQRRLALGPALDDVRERVSGLVDAGAALAEVGEYAPAIPLLRQAEQQAAAVHADTPRVFALRLLVQCWFGLDRWDDLLAGVERCRALAADLTPERTGPLCFELALSAAVHALRGEAGAAQALREQSAAVMASVSGPVETWARQQHY
jgi:tetratricopeptide (TPR) repeat protein